MMFWLAILVGVIFAGVGIRKEFFPTWKVFINILISMYASIMLTPTIVALVPDIGDSHYHHAAFVVGIAVVVFAILEVCVIGFLGKQSVTLPKIFSNVGAGVIGFLSGYLACSFVFFVICIMPFSRQSYVKKLSGKDCLAPTAVASVTKVCDLIGGVSLQCHEKGTVHTIVDWLVLSTDQAADEPNETETIDQ